MTQWQDFSVRCTDPLCGLAGRSGRRSRRFCFLHGSLDHVFYRPMLEKHKDDFPHRAPSAERMRPLEAAFRTGTISTPRAFSDDIECLRKYKKASKMTVVRPLVGRDARGHVCLRVSGARREAHAHRARAHRRAIARILPRQLPDASQPRRCARGSTRFGGSIPWSSCRARASRARPMRNTPQLFCTVWAYSPAKAAEMKLQYLKSGGFQRAAAGLPSKDFDYLFADELQKIVCPVRVINGYQDYEPITLAYQIKREAAADGGHVHQRVRTLPVGRAAGGDSSGLAGVCLRLTKPRITHSPNP